MKAIFKRTSLLLMGTLIGISTVQAQKSPKTWTASSMR